MNLKFLKYKFVMHTLSTGDPRFLRLAYSRVWPFKRDPTLTLSSWGLNFQQSKHLTMIVCLHVLDRVIMFCPLFESQNGFAASVSILLTHTISFAIYRPQVISYLLLFYVNKFSWCDILEILVIKMASNVSPQHNTTHSKHNFGV